MVFAGDRATCEGPVDKVGKRLLRPLRFRESIGVASDLDIVPIDSFLSTAGRLSPQRLRLFTSGNVVPVPGVIQVPGRDATEKELVVGFTRQCQAETLNLPTRKEAHRQVFFDQVQAVLLGTLNWDIDEAQLGRPVVFFIRVQAEFLA